MKLPYCLLALLCACTTLTDVVPTGSGTFMVASSGIAGHGSGAEQKASALTKANEYCGKVSKALAVISSTSVEPSFAKPPSSEVNFSCS